MKKLCAALLAALLLCGCREQGETVNLDGSTAMSGVVTVLGEAFQERRPEIRINCSGSGSGAGVEAALSGTSGMGLASRALTEEELARGAEGHLIAWDAIEVIVHPDNPVKALSPEALADIFTGKLRRWTQAGGEDRPIAVYGREAGSGTRDAFEEALGVVDRCTYTNEYCSAGDVAWNVAGNPNAIGYVSRAAAGDGTAAVAVDLPLRRPFLLVTREGGPRGEAAGAFLAFAESGEAAAYLRLAGAEPPGEGS